MRAGTQKIIIKTHLEQLYTNLFEKVYKMDKLRGRYK